MPKSCVEAVCTRMEGFPCVQGKSASISKSKIKTSGLVIQHGHSGSIRRTPTLCTVRLGQFGHMGCPHKLSQTGLHLS